MERLLQAYDRIDNINKEDPNVVDSENGKIAKELLYSIRMTEKLKEFEPEASEPLSIAARAQHIQRWIIPRKDYPMNRLGYKNWRQDLAKHHSKITVELIKDLKYSDPEIEEVKNLLLKKNLKVDPNVQTLEDVICLVFLQHYFDEFAAEHSEEKIINIVKKTWFKMSDRGHELALKLNYSDKAKPLILKAIS